LQRDLGKIPEAKPMDNNMKMDRTNMDHAQMKSANDPLGS